ncbi:hypothetical protein NEHOM01_0621 [Nematocida homosporus]|uniref:uncharacterized protein n=1 Tax=Nematocida homosporus TaxID=1912981 RepID=UPI00221FCF42|nr:uncharacterized protein NEHOM01_0621 [Nematocida homosporus]KAI5185116.1 hypothetical protein NEHOM01_0621 [Nematocida homosporus]
MSYLKSRVARITDRNCPFKIVKWMAIVKLLVLLNVVCGSVEDSECELVDRTRECELVDKSKVYNEKLRARWTESAKMVARLKKLGFGPFEDNSTVLIKSYSLEQPTTAETSANPSPSPTIPEETDLSGVSMVDTNSKSIEFIMPEYSSADEASAAFALLNTIAVIKVLRALITYTEVKSEWYETNILIVTRVINMIQCDELQLDLKCITERNAENQSICDASLREAKKVVDLIPKLPSTLVVMSDTFPQGNNNVIAIQQQFLSIHFYQIDKLPRNIDHLCLRDDFNVVVFPNPTQPTINLTFLSRTSTKCSEITIKAAGEQHLLIVGLERRIKQHEGIKLVIDWVDLQRMSNTSKHQIHVHTIIVQADGPLYTNLPGLSKSQPKPGRSRIFAEKIVVLAGTLFPCKASESSIDNYIRVACVKYGISIKTTEVRYQADRSDFCETLRTLCTLGALPKLEEESYSDNSCLGYKLKDADHITIAVPVNFLVFPIYYGHCHIDPNCFHLKIRENQYFCQHIHYTDINITGEHKCLGLIPTLAIDILSQFRDITAKKLTIKNIRKHCYTGSFSLTELNKVIASERHQYNMKVDVLTLDNVDDMIVHWVLGKYAFVGSVEVHILNQSYKNLAITQILSHWKARNIVKLVLNDLFEVKDINPDTFENPTTSDQKLDLDKNYHFFSYVAKKEQEGYRLQNLCLYKLVLQLGIIDRDLYAKVLSKLASLKVQCQIVSGQEYITNAIINYNNRVCELRHKEFKLYKLKIKWLERDLAIRNNESLSQPNQTQSNASLVQNTQAGTFTLHFQTGQILTEEALTTIIRWVNCISVGLKTWKLSNLVIPEKERSKITRASFWVSGMDSFFTFQIRGNDLIACRDELADNLLQKLASSIIDFSKDVVTFVKSSSLHQLVNLDSARFEPETPIHRFLKYFQATEVAYSCIYCLSDLYLSDELRDQLNERLIKRLVDEATKGLDDEEKKKEIEATMRNELENKLWEYKEELTEAEKKLVEDIKQLDKDKKEMATRKANLTDQQQALIGPMSFVFVQNQIHDRQLREREEEEVRSKKSWLACAFSWFTSQPNNNTMSTEADANRARLREEQTPMWLRRVTEQVDREVDRHEMLQKQAYIDEQKIYQREKCLSEFKKSKVSGQYSTFEDICYFNCGHFVCSDCLFSLMSDKNWIKCLICQEVVPSSHVYRQLVVKTFPISMFDKSRIEAHNGLNEALTTTPDEKHYLIYCVDTYVQEPNENTTKPKDTTDHPSQSSTQAADILPDQIHLLD